MTMALTIPFVIHPVVATCMAHHMVTGSCCSFSDVKTRKSIINGDNTVHRNDRLNCKKGQQLCHHFVSFADIDLSKRDIHPEIFKTALPIWGLE